MQKVIPVLALLLLLVACQSAAPETTSDAVSLDDGAVVVFTRSGGFDGRTMAWRIYADGRVTVTTVTAGAEETQEMSVPPGRVDELLAELESAGFFDLNGDYMPEDDCCDRFYYRLTADNGDQTNTIATVEATQSNPLTVWESIGVLEKFIFQDVNQGNS